LNIISKKLTQNGINIPINDQTIDTETDFLTFTASSYLKKDETYRVDIEFTGTILDKLYGFYRSSYKVKEKTS
jgi:hypothetical protein